MATIPESHRDLLTIPGGVTILSTIGADGAPQTTALWFVYDEDGALKLSLNRSRQKTKNIERNPVVTLFFLDPANPYRTLEVRGVAHLDPDADGAVAEKVNVKYGAHVQDNDRPGEERIAATIHITKVNVFPPA
jgi:PPOX class probable F420-dependent enzyme